MEEVNFNVDQVFNGLEPGDDASYTVHVCNKHEKTTRWYMSNKVLKSLEESAAANLIKGGAYTYRLVYEGPKGTETVIFDSTDNSIHFVGGAKYAGDVMKAADDRVGLNEATDNLEDFFFLDTLNSGESGKVKLYVALEGETQNNDYQNTAARIQMNFAVELADKSNRTAVKTGDETNLLPYYIGMIAAGLLFLYLALDAYTDRLYKRGRY